MDWIMDLFTNLYTRLRSTTVTAPSLIAHALSLFQPAVFTSRFLAAALNCGDSSASRAQVLLSQPYMQNSTQLSPELQYNLFLAPFAELN
jgi:hypothetical protein